MRWRTSARWNMRRAPGVPFEHYSEDQLARLEELAERHCGIDPDFCTSADN